MLTTWASTLLLELNSVVNVSLPPTLPLPQNYLSTRGPEQVEIRSTPFVLGRGHISWKRGGKGDHTDI